MSRVRTTTALMAAMLAMTAGPMPAPATPRRRLLTPEERRERAAARGLHAELLELGAQIRSAPKRERKTLIREHNRVSAELRALRDGGSA